MKVTRILLLCLLIGTCWEARAQYCPLTGCTYTGPIAGPEINTVYVADNYSGADIGARINNAVAACKTAGIVCTIQVNMSGTISTPPVLPMGFSLSFNPTGVYTLDANWVLNHRGVSLYFNGAHLTYSKADNGVAIYVGKNISSTVDVSGPAGSCTGSVITWVSGSQFSNIDVGDQISFDYSSTVYTANVGAVTATSLCLLGNLGLTENNLPMVAIMSSSTGLGSYSGASVTLRDLVLNDSSASATDTGLELELVTNVRVDDFVGYNFRAGTCTKLLGALVSNFSALQCNVDGSGLILSNNALGGFTVTGSNANRFYGVDLINSPLASGFALYDLASIGNLFSGLHVEGNANASVMYETGGQNHYQFIDYERNGTGASYEITVGSSYNLIEGPSQMQTYNKYLMAVSGGSGNLIQNLQFNATGSGAYALNCISSCNMKFQNNAVLAGSVDGLPQVGIASLTSGAVTVNTVAACTPSSTCEYKLANCGKNSSSTIGTPSVGPITSGTSFEIVSLSSTATVATGDASSICWQIN